MTTTTLTYLRLLDVKAIRFVCEGSWAGAVLEVPVGQLNQVLHTLQSNNCPVCRRFIWEKVPEAFAAGSNPIDYLVRSLAALTADAGAHMEVEFVFSEDASAGNGQGPVGGSAAYQPLSLEEVERDHILKTLAHTHWKKSQAAYLLKIERSTLDRKIKMYGLHQDVELSGG
jgi:hypothetical protein